MRRAFPVLLLLSAGLALGSQTRLRLERIDPTEFADSGKLRVFASVVELEGNVVEDKAPPMFRLLIDGKPAGAPQAATRFQAAGEALDLVLVVESSALYGPQKVVAPPPAPPPPKQKGKQKPAPRPKGKTKTKAPVPPPSAPKPVATGEEPLDKVKDAVKQLLEGLGARARVFVIEYGGDVVPHPPFRPAQAAESAVDDLSPDDESGDLRLVDAVRAALVELNKPRADGKQARRLIALVSDGLNSQMDRKAFRALGDAAAKAHVPIHSIAFSPSDERGPLLNLGEISKRSNGTFRWARTADDLRAQIETLADELNKQYVLTFQLDVRSLEGKTLQLSCEGITSNLLRYDAEGGAFGGAPLARRLIPIWAWFAGGGAVLLIVIVALVLRRPKKRFPTKRPQPVPRQAAAAGGAPIAQPRPQPVAQPSARGVLIVVSGRLAGTRVPLGAQPVTVGKGPSTLQIDDDPTVSTRHAEIRAERGFVVVDLGSTNGTFVNNQRVQGTMALTDGDLIRFGNTQIKFRTE